MAEHRLKIDIRREAILSELAREGRVSVSQLSRMLHVTPVTIRNDLAALVKDGKAERISGGAIWHGQTNVPGSTGSAAGAAPGDLLSEEKEKIGACAAQLIRDGSTLFVSAGTTCEHFAAALRTRRDLNVVTNSLAVAQALSGLPSIHVVMLGGEMNSQYGYTCGADALAQLARYQAQWAVLSVDGITAQEGATSCHSDEAPVNRLMIERAARVMVIADHTKIGKAGFAFLCPPGPGMTLVTGSECDQNVLRDLEAEEVAAQLV